MSPETETRELFSFDGPAGDHAIEVMPRIWWVGDVIDDPFQSHPYLIEAGESSVLVDPGSTLTIDATLRKIEQVMPLDQIATILLHHVDPDISDSIHRLGEVLTRPDVKILTEWRSAILIRHLVPAFEIEHVEDLGWKLDLGEGRMLEFAPTPYLHFPGAFVSYVWDVGALLSSDLFGGFNRGRRLIAAGPEDFEDLRSFHEHYMPSREILMSGLSVIRSRFPKIVSVLPQHGYVIPESLVDDMFDQLFGLECGVMLMSKGDAHLARLLEVAAVVRRIEEFLQSDRSLGELLYLTRQTLATIIPVTAMSTERVRADGEVSRIAESALHWVVVGERTKSTDTTWLASVGDDGDGGEITLVVELAESAGSIETEVATMLVTLVEQVQRATVHSLQLRSAREEIIRWENTATHDPLTGLLNRRVLDETAERGTSSGALMVDIDLFKSVNDDFGHDVGDIVLVEVAAAISDMVRSADLVVRYGGEEIVVLVPHDPSGDLQGQRAALAGLGERIRAAIEALEIEPLSPDRTVTVSIGAALPESDETVGNTVVRADQALYRAKNSGRNRVVCSWSTADE